VQNREVSPLVKNNNGSLIAEKGYNTGGSTSSGEKEGAIASSMNGTTQSFSVPQKRLHSGRRQMKMTKPWGGKARVGAEEVRRWGKCKSTQLEPC